MKTIPKNAFNGNQKPSQRTYLDNRATTKHQPAKPQCLSKVLSVRNETKKKLVGLLMPLDSGLADRVNKCGAKFSAVTCGSHIIGRKPHDKCNFRHCPNCAPRNSRKCVEKYVPLVVAFLKHSSVPVVPVHLVLTLKHRRGETAKQGHNRLIGTTKKPGALKKLIRREFWNAHFLGAIYKVEQVQGTDGAWHNHVHLLAFRRRFFDVGLLRREWLKVTGDSHVLRLDPITDIRAGLVEICKYVLKPSDIDRFEVAHLRQVLELKGQKMIGTVGEFRAFCKDYKLIDDPELIESRREFFEGEACPICSEPLFEVSLSVDELIRHARRLEAVPKYRYAELKL